MRSTQTRVLKLPSSSHGASLQIGCRCGKWWSVGAGCERAQTEPRPAYRPRGELVCNESLRCSPCCRLCSSKAHIISPFHFSARAQPGWEEYRLQPSQVEAGASQAGQAVGTRYYYSPSQGISKWERPWPSNVKLMAAGRNHSVAVGWNGDVWSWGLGSGHEFVHNGLTIERLKPMRVSFPMGGCAVKSVAGVYCLAARGPALVVLRGSWLKFI
jgi:hypothetical protein